MAELGKKTSKPGPNNLALCKLYIWESVDHNGCSYPVHVEELIGKLSKHSFTTWFLFKTLAQGRTQTLSPT